MAETETPRALYAVMGNPVAHSQSPRMHGLFAQQCRHAIEYEAILVERGRLPQAVEEFRARAGRGLNITLPFKLEAVRLATQLSDRATLAGAVNTLKFEPDGSAFGDNTDGAGLVHDLLRNLAVALRGQRLLVIGAGGAARGVLGPLLKQRPDLLVIVNRTVSKAEALAESFARYGKIEACGFRDLVGRRFDVVINGTSASLHGELPPLPVNLFAAGAVAYDMMYGDRPTRFLEWAVPHGAGRVADGLGMLVEQAAESYLLWHGVRPETRQVIETLRRGS